MVTGTSYRTPGTLPPQTSEFVGREADLARTRELLRGSRLTTITGPGGVGKTRLAVRAAADAAADYRDGVHFIELSAVRDPELLAHTLAAGFTLAGQTAEAEHGSQLDSLLGYLRDRELLLILDTCEHVIDACAALADTILRAVPGVTILATSRQPLDAAGEAVQLLCPLPVPDGSSAAAGKADAVELFALRAAAAVPGFAVTAENLADVVAVCRRLDGIPLAIELATVRLRALPVHEMAELIDDRLRLLTGGRRSGTTRHQTLRAAIEWSYDLCTPAEQLLWARLSVFAGGFDIEAAENVCADRELGPDEIVPTLISLVDKSLLARDSAPDADLAAGDVPGTPAFRMLDTIREFGAERLHLADTRAVVPWRTGRAERADGYSAEIAPAPAAVRGRFIAHYLALAEEFERDPASGQLGKLQRLLREHPNLRAAFEYALDLPGNDSAAILLATSLCPYWEYTSQLREAEYWLDQALGRCPKRSVVRARVLAVRGYVRAKLGDIANGSADAAAAIAMAAPFSDLAAAARGYTALHFALTSSKNLDEAQDAARAAAERYTSLGDAVGLAHLDLVDAMLSLQTGEIDRCFESATRGLARLPDDEVWCSSNIYGLQSIVLFLRGDIDAAQSAGLLALMMKQQIRDEIGIAYGLGALAFMAAGQGRCERTAWLFGAAAPLWDRSGRWYQGNPGFEALHEVAERIARTSLGDERYWELRAAGGAAPLGQAVERALANADQLTEASLRP
jgi:predicted ATPase